MLGDAVSAKKAAGQAKDTLEVIDVAQLLARSVSTTANDGSPAAADGTATATVRRSVSERLHDKGNDEMVTSIPVRPIH